MENLKDTKTADLVAEWNRLEGIIKHHAAGIYSVAAKNCLPYLPSVKEKDQAINGKNAIAAELDNRCRSIEIDHRDGYTKVTHDGLEWWSNPDDIDDDDLAEIEIKKFETQRLAELHALLGWLLLKENNK
jgi:hypothetical protein